MAASKDTIYVDVNDEITSVIDKINNSKSKVVALVLPKRAALFQSIVNLKLIERASTQAKKSIVLITSDQTLLPLAGAVGIYVAKTLQSKPEIPERPLGYSVSGSESDEEAPLDKEATVGELIEEDAPIEIDNTTPDDSKTKPTKTQKKPYDKKLKVPNFNKFRLKLILGIVGFVLVLVFWILAVFVLPKAQIVISTDTTDVPINVNITSSPAIRNVDTNTSRVPGSVKELRKSDTVRVASTGQKNVGTKASGEIALTLKDCSEPSVTIPSGTTVSAGNNNFITQSSVTLLSTVKGGKCNNDDDATGVTKVVAQNAGDQYNLSARAYSVAGFSNVSGAGHAMSGGTSRIIKVVSQSDIDGAKQKLLDGFNSGANQELSEQLRKDNFMPLTDTFVSKEPLVTSNPTADSEADEVTVNVSISFTMIGASNDGVKEIVESTIGQKIDSDKQKILDNGMGSAAIRIESKQANGQVIFSLQTTAKAGVEQDEASIKESIKGKKKGEVQSILLERPGIKDVQVNMSPFWVYKVPDKDNRITLIFEQKGNTENDTN